MQHYTKERPSMNHAVYRKFAFALTLSFILFGSCIPTVSGQTLYGSLVGNITDPSGATVPEAKISVSNTDTGFTREVLSNDRGAYLIPDLQAGHYDVTVSSQSFAIFNQRG